MTITGTKPFRTLATIKIGTGLRTADDFQRVSDEKGLKIDLWAVDVLKQPEFEVTAEETEIDLVEASLHQLGFKSRAQLQQVFDRILELGYEFCPAEVGPQLHIQYLPKRVDELWHMAMVPFTDSAGSCAIFSIERQGNLYVLHCDTGLSSSVWEINDRFVFVKPRK